jgi:hypothetical protein
LVAYHFSKSLWLLNELQFEMRIKLAGRPKSLFATAVMVNPANAGSDGR